ncbi:MAG: tRNA (guanosine(46)-N7)-methyltransferase TrmB, partial [Erysipelotrichaceae bacterium]|nr:tRNA (guanosine(46)-N7)-methyltransferase TrmB [Erysipelotrichaceae bacterium]
MRKRKWVAPFLAKNHDCLIENSDQIKDLGKPLSLEVGCGLGDFIIELAGKNPDRIYLAIERDETCIAKCVRKCEELALANLYFMHGNLDDLYKKIEDLRFETIYLLFSDPWPKKGYHKRRLTTHKYLLMYEHILLPEGSIYIKTDNQDLFEYSKEEFTKTDFILEAISTDFHDEIKDGMPLTG